MYLCLSLGSCGVLYLCCCNYSIQYKGRMAGGKGVSTWSEAVRTWAKAVHKRRHLARSPTASSTRSVTRIQTGQPQGRAQQPGQRPHAIMTPVAPRCLLSCRSPLQTTRLQKSWRNLPPRLTCMLRRHSSSQWESSRPAISQRFSRRMRSRVVSIFFPNALQAAAEEAFRPLDGRPRAGGRNGSLHLQP